MKAKSKQQTKNKFSIGESVWYSKDGVAVKEKIVGMVQSDKQHKPFFYLFDIGVVDDFTGVYLRAESPKMEDSVFLTKPELTKHMKEKSKEQSGKVSNVLDRIIKILEERAKQDESKRTGK